MRSAALLALATITIIVVKTVEHVRSRLRLSDLKEAPLGPLVEVEEEGGDLVLVWLEWPGERRRGPMTAHGIGRGGTTVDQGAGGPSHVFWSDYILL